MPIPVVVWGIAALGGGFLTGSLSRQKEINRLHVQVNILQEEIKKLQEEVKNLKKLVEEQDRQINVLISKYKVAQGINFIEKAKAKNKAKGAVMYTYCLKEYLDINYNILNKVDYKMSNEEEAFYEAFEKVLNGEISNSPEDNALKYYIKVYIRNLYSSEIDNLEEANLKNTFERINKMGNKESA